MRDALQRLAAEGLVEIRRPCGHVRRALDRADLEELYELREAIEPVAARLGLPNVGRAQLLQMEQLHRRLADERDPRSGCS